MLASSEMIEMVAGIMTRHHIPELVVDPVRLCLDM